MRQFIVVLLLFSLTALLSCSSTSSSSPFSPRSSFVSAEIVSEKGTVLLSVDAEQAQTHEELARGLMNRDSLPADRGMLFFFGQPRTVGFWMRNVSFPLDLIFIENNSVSRVYRNVPPCLLPTPDDECPRYIGTADTMLEVNGGIAKAVVVGNKVSILSIS